MAKVSIVIPFYNNIELLVEMIESILNQRYSDWELLLINDGADLETIRLIYNYQNSDGRIKIIERDRLPKGAQTCRNIGLQKSIGEYVCFFDSDDLLTPHCLGNRVKFMDENKDLDFAVFRAHSYDSTSNSRIRIFGAKKTSDDIKFFINGVVPFAVWTNIYRRRSLVKCNAIWDEKLLSLQDSDFNIQNILQKKMKYCYYEGSEPDYLWRINHNSNSITKKIKSREHYNSHLYFMKKTIRTVHANCGTFYDKDLRQRIFDLDLVFLENYDLGIIETFNNMMQLEELQKFSLFKFLNFKKLNDIFNNKRLFRVLLKFAIFPKHIYYYYSIRHKYKTDTMVR